MRKTALVLVIITVVLLAGCGKKENPSPTASTPATFGTVEGRVLDDASAAVTGASVRVLLTPLSVPTDAEGAYRIENVPSGTIRVVASGDGYTSQTKTAQLDANRKITLNFVLEAVPTLEPRVETKQFSGTILCGFFAGASCPQDPQADPEQTAVVHPFDVAFDLRGIVFELQWDEPASGVNTNLAYDVHAASPDGCGARYNGTVGPSILRLEVLEGFPVSGGNQCVVVRPPGDQATVQQTYTMYVTLFYHAPPPPGFSAISA